MIELDKTTEKYNQEFKNLNEQQRIQVLSLNPAFIPKASEMIDYIGQGKHFASLVDGEEPKPINFYDLPENRKPYSYKDKENDSFLREKDGTMLLNNKISDLQKKAVKTVLGQIVKKILSADLTGLNLPIFFFDSKTYLHG